MSGHWWSVNVFQPEPSWKGHSSIAAQLTASAWRRIVDRALQRIDEHPLPGDEMQPWRKQQLAMMKTAMKKANRQKKRRNNDNNNNNNNNKTKETTSGHRRVANKQQEQQPHVKGKRKEGSTMNKKRKRETGKERMPLDEEDSKDDNAQNGEEEEEEVIAYDGKCRKICVFFNETQKQLIKQWMGTARWTYNACNAAVRAGLCGFSTGELRARFLSSEAFGKAAGRSAKGKPAAKKKKTLIPPLTKRQTKAWRKALEPAGHFPSPSCAWVLDTPSDIRDQAIKELTQAYSNGLKAHGSLGAFQVQFKSAKKLCQQTITIGAREWNRSAKGNAKDSVYCQLFNRGKALRSREKDDLPETMTHEFKLVRTRLGRYYLCMPTDLNDADSRKEKNNKKKKKKKKSANTKKEKEEKEKNKRQSPLCGSGDSEEEQKEQIGKECVFIDPGVRTFVTTFDLQGRIHEFGKGSIKRIERLCYYLDDLISRTNAKRPEDKARFVQGKKKRWRMRRAALRMRRRIRNLVDEAHRKIALWLCENYRVIVWPLSGVQNMVTKKQRKIQKKNNKAEEKGNIEGEGVVNGAISSPSEETQERKSQLKQCKRRINSKTVRSMLTWSWYRFQQWLKHKVREFPECRLVLASEAYTTKTCTHCGQQNDNVGSGEVFRCADGGCANREAPRDHHGARNIGIRFLTEWATARKGRNNIRTTSAHPTTDEIVTSVQTVHEQMTRLREKGGEM